MSVYPKIKRILDFILSALAMLVLWPIFALIAIVIKIDSKGPVFFKQKRLGKGKKEFFILKFRTMRTDTPKDMPTHMLQNPDVFITRVGKFLRKSSLDELPQIINILRGEMSIIGPRPALWNQYDLIAKRDKYGANDIYPGLTGWAQINGRDEIPIPLKVSMDGYYVKNLNFTMDLKIFFMTILNVVMAKDVVEGTVFSNNIEDNKNNIAN